MENLEVMEKSWKSTWSGKVREIYRKILENLEKSWKFV